MRCTTIIALAGLVGCANGGGRGPHFGAHDAGPFPETDSSVPHDAGAPTHDSGTPRPGTDAGPLAHDAGTPATSHDAGPSPAVDAGTPAADAGSETFDAGFDAGLDPGPPGPPIAGDSCTVPLDVSTGGTFMIDTCLAHPDVTFTCGAAHGRDVVVRGDAPRSGSTYHLQADVGWIIQQVDTGCRSMVGSCGAVSWGVSGATFDPAWFWAIEKSDGSCGMVALTVTRDM